MSTFWAYNIITCTWNRYYQNMKVIKVAFPFISCNSTNTIRYKVTKQDFKDILLIDLPEVEIPRHQFKIKLRFLPHQI